VKKPFLRRLARDHSQRIRLGVQLFFVALTLWIGVEFTLFVRYYESGGRTLYVQRPPGVEGWLPIASLMNLKYLVLTGRMPELHASGMLLLLAFLAISVLLRKAFCGWICPVGTLSEYLWRVGRNTFGRNFTLPRWLDIPLRGLKYLLLGFFGYVIAGMSADAIRAFLDGPYGVVADVKMLNFFRDMTVGGAISLGVLAGASFFIQNFWCRYLCPYGALMGLASLLSPLRIRRVPALCIDCAKCAKACPSVLPVDRLVTIRSAECLGCMQCVSVCPAGGALHMSAPRRRPVPAWAMAAAMLAIFFGVCAWGQVTGYWHSDIPAWVYANLIPRAREFSHP
jgi:polyferredoxin